MLDRINTRDIPDGGIFPKGVYIMNIGSGDNAPAFTPSQRSGREMAVIPVSVQQVISGGANEDANWTIRITVGTEEDPAADLEDTWKGRGGQDMKKFWHGVYGQDADIDGNPVDLLAGTAGATVGVVCDIDGDFNRWQFYPPDQEPPPHREAKPTKRGVEPASRSPQERAATPAPRRPQPAAVARGNGEDTHNEPAPASVRPAARAVPQRPAPPRR